jgi:hypothetical protein
LDKHESNLRSKKTSYGPREKIGQNGYQDGFRWAILPKSPQKITFYDRSEDFPTYQIFAHLCPGEYFHPNTSPSRVHQAILELRSWLERNNIQLEVSELNGFYSLSGSATILVPENSWWEQNNRGGIFEMRKYFQEKYFTPREISKIFDVPRRSAFHLVQKCLESGLVIKEGAGPTTRYRFA